ncbi:hypothetical protein FA10DRAFT_258713 [Acaromyces ingoldii]|uniref:Uncharacterized protein n=1 Tax=Acaromyces ingoldii TaxID=215250 RepID=A0A316YPJ7_9BASI|nr:hypothetical protein FA10DRAFT_258713 [Acaromyces ingoldii]PWN91307.1 hypothetical protein FA10DRAFT_258713 [Acaromyces ingoldii]
MLVFHLSIIFAFSAAAAPPPKHHGQIEHTGTQHPPAPHKPTPPGLRNPNAYQEDEPHHTLQYYYTQNHPHFHPQLFHPQFHPQSDPQDVFQYDVHGHVGGAHHYQAPGASGLQISQNYELLRQLHQVYAQDPSGAHGHPAGFDGSMSEQAYSQVDPQLHPLHWLGNEGIDPHLFASFSLDPDLRHKHLNAQEDGYETMQNEHNERSQREEGKESEAGDGRGRKGKEKKAGEGRGRGKGKGKKQSPDQSQTSSFTSSRESHDEPAPADCYPMDPMECTSEPHQVPMDIDTMIEKRFEFLRKSDAYQRGQLGLPDRSRHATLSLEFEQKRKNARLLVQYARDLLKSPDKQRTRVKQLCQKVTTASDEAKGSPKPESVRRWLDRKKRATRD